VAPDPTSEDLPPVPTLTTTERVRPDLSRAGWPLLAVLALVGTARRRLTGNDVMRSLADAPHLCVEVVAKRLGGQCFDGFA